MHKFYSGWELLKRWGIQPFQLLQIIQVGSLKPYNKFGEIAPRPDCEEHMREDNLLSLKIRDLRYELDVKSEKGITKAEYEKLTTEIQETEKKRKEIEDMQFWHPHSWHFYYPQDDKDPDKSLEKICDFAFREFEVKKLDKFFHPSDEQQTAYPEKDLESNSDNDDVTETQLDDGIEGIIKSLHPWPMKKGKIGRLKGELTDPSQTPLTEQEINFIDQKEIKKPQRECQTDCQKELGKRSRYNNCGYDYERRY